MHQINRFLAYSKQNIRGETENQWYEMQRRGDMRDGKETQKQHTVGKWSYKIAIFLFGKQFLVFGCEERSFERGPNKNPSFTPTHFSQRAFNMWIPNPPRSSSGACFTLAISFELVWFGSNIFCFHTHNVEYKETPKIYSIRS